MPNADTAAMNAHLAELSRTVSEGTHAVLVLDGAGWHGAKALIVRDNITLLPLPPYAPELSPVETVRAYLRANRLAISVLETYDDIVARSCDAWTFFANDTATVRSMTTREYAKAVKGQGRWYQTRKIHGLTVPSRMSKGAVGGYLSKARAARLSWPLPAECDDDDALERLLFPGVAGSHRFDRSAPDWTAADRELPRPA